VASVMSIAGSRSSGMGAGREPAMSSGVKLCHNLVLISQIVRENRTHSRTTRVVMLWKAWGFRSPFIAVIATAGVTPAPVMNYLLHFDSTTEPGNRMRSRSASQLTRLI